MKRRTRIILGDTIAILVIRYKDRYPVSVIIDKADLPLVSGYKWYVHSAQSKRTWYAAAWRVNEMHRLLLQPSIGLVTDHANGRGTDNRRCNLRPATRRENVIHSRPTATSGFKGVYIDKRMRLKPFFARLKLHGKCLYFGNFATAIEAAKAYDAAAVKHLGPFAWLNFQ